MKNLLFSGLVAAAAVATNSSAAIDVGDTLTLSRVGTQPGKTVWHDYDSSRAWNQALPSGATGSLAIAGITTFNVAGGGQVQTFCIEINEGFPDDPISYTVAELTNVPEESPPGAMSAAQASVLQDLYARYYADIITDDAGETWANRSDEAAAFQLVIWEITHENMTGASTASDVVSRLDISMGAMAFTNTANANVASIASSMISSLGSGGFQLMTNLLGLTNPDNQDMLIVVPTPAIAGLAGLGLVGMRRRRR